jgi:hypothetical protein
MQELVRDPPSRRVRFVLASFDLITAAVVVALASVLWSANVLWVVALWVWAALLVASAIGLVVGSRVGRFAGRAAAVYQLSFLLVIVVSILTSVAHLWGLYGQIGIGIAAALLLVLAVVFEVVGLLPLFKLRALGVTERPVTRTGAKVLAVSAVVVAAATVFHLGAVKAHASLPAWEPLSPETRHAVAESLAEVLHGETPSPRLTREGEPDDRWVIRVYHRGRLESRVEVAGNARDATLAAVEALARTEPRSPGSRSIAIDRVVAESGLDLGGGIRSALSVVPGLDGVSGEIEGRRYTITPHELVLRRMLSEHTPIPFIPDFEIGIDLHSVLPILCKRAGQEPDCAVTEIRRSRTEQWAHRRGETYELYRGRPVDDSPPTAEDARAGARAAGYYVVRSLRRDGRFRYKLHPDTGKTSMRPYNVPRHAGTSWFLLELYEATAGHTFLRSAERALDWLERRMTDCGTGLRCIASGDHAVLGSQALPLIAFATHARVTGSDRYRESIDRLSEVVRKMQREDGDFDFVLDAKTGESIPGGRALYAGGQAVLALAISGQVTEDPDRIDASRRGMDFLVGPYWSFPLADFFFIEEHWTCLAADELHRLFEKPEYARFCRDAAHFDRRLQHAKGETVFADYVGGIGFSPFFPPYTTTAAGRTEGMLAAYRMSEREGAPDPELRAGIVETVGFLLHNQYGPKDTYAFRSALDAVGGVPWNYYDPVIRIDTVQHAGSVLLHGAELLPDPSPR